MTAAAPPRIGLDIGGSKTAGIVLDGAGRVEASVDVPTRRGTEGVQETAVQVVDALAERTGRSVEAFASLGVGIPGQVSGGEVRNAYNIGVEALALAPLLSARTGLPVSLDNDVTAAAIGAAHLMRLGGSVAYLNLGTGLAAGFVVDGRPLRGAHGLSGEIGHLPVDPLGRACPCGQTGCLETVASGSALLRYWPAGGAHPGRALLAAVDAGDEDARTAFELLVSGAARAVRMLALTLDPDAVVIGGGLRLLGAPLIEGIRRVLSGWAAESPFLAAFEAESRLRALPDGSPAAAVGAALAGEY